MQLVLDAHTDKVSSGSISDNFRGFYTVIDGRDKYPFISRNGIPIKSGQENEFLIGATRYDADKKIKHVKASKRNCYFPEEHPLKLHKVYSQANCFFQCKIEHVRKQMHTENQTEGTCAPWFYPVENQYLHEICDPWRTAQFQELLKMVADDQCRECLPDCSFTEYTSSVSSAPFRSCDRTNLGVSPLCDLSSGADMMMNPPIWKQTIHEEYEKFNGGDLPDFIKKQPNVLSNIRNYTASDQDVKNLVLRAQREKRLAYNALEEDIAIVNFYFDKSVAVQFTTSLRMTWLDFISSVSCITS